MSFSAENKCDQFKHELDKAYSKAGCLDLDTADSVVKRFSGTLIPLIKPKSYSVRVCGQDGTVYAGNDDQLEAWKDFYLPERMEMVVLGAIDDFPCDAFGLQLVLLLCEDGKIYACEDEELHLVARSVNELYKTGLTFPGLECHKLGECFEDYTEEEYNEIMESDDMKKMKEAHDKYRESLENELWETLKEFKRSQCEDVVQRSMVQPQNSDAMKECKELVIRKDMPVVPSDGKLFNNACLYECTVSTVKGYFNRNIWAPADSCKFPISLTLLQFMKPNRYSPTASLNPLIIKF